MVQSHEPHENTLMYIMALLDLVCTCKFNDYSGDAIIDQPSERCSSQALRCRLLKAGKSRHIL